MDEPLVGGNTSAVVRRGAAVVRPARPWTPAVQALLRHLEDRGFAGAPRALGLDGEGHELVSFLPGTVPRYPLPAAVLTDDALSAVARLVRAFHDATVGFRPPSEARWWRMPGAPEDGEVVCHNDLAPYNTVYDGGLPVAFIDWDTASPGPRVWDVAHAVWRFVPLTAGADPVAAGRRVRRFCDAYGLAERDDLPALVRRRQQCLHDTVLEQARLGVPAFQAMVGTDHVEGPLRDRAWVLANQATLAAALA
jgi:Ser/Thr protein kinase RdoA (MazF antagonist)